MGYRTIKHDAKLELVERLLALAFIAAPVSQAQVRNTTCSGKMGGVSHCLKNGKFVCKNGKISQSKQVCR